jgi:phosphate transport system substrate-binding protein
LEKKWTHEKDKNMSRKLSVIGLMGFILLCMSAVRVAAQDKVIFGGAGTMGKGSSALAAAYKEKNPSDSVDVLTDSMSTTGGIEGTKTGRLTVAIITRSVTDAEKKEGLVSRPIARIRIVVGVHKSLPISELSDSQVCDVFSGKIKNWKDVGGGDAKITVVGRKKDDNNIEEFREKMGCFKSLQVASDAVLLVRGSDVLDTLNNRPGSVSIVDAAGSMMERPNIKALSVAGAAPTLEGVKNASTSTSAKSVW